MGATSGLLLLTPPFRRLLFLYSIFWVILFTSGKLVNFDLSSTHDPSSSSLTIDSPDILEVFADELQELRMDLTKSFIVEHSRRKREILKYSYEVSQNQNTKSTDSFEARMDPIGYSTCQYKNQTYVFQADGIYRLDGLQDVRNLESYPGHNLVKVTPMTMDVGEHVLTTHEWDGILFILTSNQDGSHCKLYTVHGPAHILTMKHQIKNEGYATAAEFFVHSFELYLIIATDNVAHSLTITPIYRWSQTYMDQIHEIQTRGAVALVSFSVSSYTYIAIAQGQDAAGNYEVGTLVVRVYGKGELEKVQLLWSIEPVSLSYVRFLKEHLLVIGQKKESSICYWFGGYQFVYWQSLDGLQGNSVYLDSFVLPDNEPLLLASTDKTVSLYSRIKNTQIGETWMLNQSSVIYAASSASDRIIEARFLRTLPKQTHNDLSVYVALTIQSSVASTTLKVFPLTLQRVDVGKSQGDLEDKLSLCMLSLKERLDHDESSIVHMESQNNLIFTKSGDLTYTGSLVSQGEIIIPRSLAVIDVVDIHPDLEYPEDRYSFSPSRMLHGASKEIGAFEKLVAQKLDQVLLKSKLGNITGDLTFLQTLHIQNLKSYSPVYLETLNDVLWSKLEHDVLKREALLPQTVTGSWEIETLKANEIQTGDRIGESFVGNFLLTTYEYGNGNEKETINGKVTFARNIEIEDLRLGSYAIINDIPFGEIALRSEKYVEIHGYKHAEYVNGDEQLNIDLINGLKLAAWYESMMKIDGVIEEFSSGTKIFAGDLVINALQVDVLNRLKWNDFAESILLDGKNQTIAGSLSCSKMNVNSLHVETINGVYVDDWMTTSTNQEVHSDIHVNELKIRQNLLTQSINKIHLEDAVLSKQPRVRILGPVELKGITTGDIMMTPYTRLNGIHISTAAKLRKKHIYYTDKAEILTLDGNVQIFNLIANSLNGVPFNSIRDAYWRTDTENVIQSDFSFGSSKIVVERDFSTGTFNSLDVERDIVTTTSDAVISRNIQFISDVIVDGAVVTPDGVTLNDYDISELVKDIVRTTDGKRRIRGRKEFVDLIEARQGIEVKTINGISLESEMVLLQGYATQEIYGHKKFLDVVAEEVFSEVDIQVEGYVNGEELTDVISSTLYSDGEIVQIESFLIFEKTIAAEEIYVKNEINGIIFTDIVGNLIELDEAQVLSTPLILSGGTLRFLRPSEVDFINGISPRDYLSQVASWRADETFIGNKEFRVVLVKGDLACHLINNVNLTDLQLRAFSKTKNQFVSGKFTFQELQSTGNLITSKISGIPITHFVRTDKDTTIKSDLTFLNHQIKVDGKISLNGLLNDHKIEEVAGRLRSLEGNRKFDTVTIEGNLNWETDASPGRFSHLFHNSVTISSPQTIHGKVTFLNGLRVNTLLSQNWINSVNLAHMLNDSVQRNAPMDFTGEYIFETDIEVLRGEVTVARHLDTAKVNNIILPQMYQDVVRVNSPKRIHGKKIFTRGLSTQKLNVYGEIDYVSPKDLITVNDRRVVDRVTLNSVTILKNLNYQRLNHYEIEALLRERITLDQDQRIYADLIFHEDLIVQDCTTESINGLRLSDVFLQNYFQPQKFTGQKTFENLLIDGSLENVAINNIMLDEIAEQLLGLRRDEVIHRHVVFTDTVHLAQSIEIIGDDSDYAIGLIAEAFTSDLENIVDNVLVSQETKQRMTDSLLELEKTQENKAVWLDYLELDHELAMFHNGSRHRVESFVYSNENDGMTIAFHAPTLETHGALPVGCTCNSIRFLFMRGVVKPLEQVNCVNIFDVNAPRGESYTIYSQVISYNKTCSRKELGSTYISSAPGKSDFLNVRRGSPIGNADWSVGQIETGYISDAKAFGVNDKQYLVIAQFYDHKSASHDTEVLVYETNGRTLEKIQGIPSHGAHRLALELVNGNWTLLVGNTGGSGFLSGYPCPTTASAIYEWSPAKSQFILLREVQTEGLVDVALVTVQKNAYFHEAYASFAENGAEGQFGKVSIYRYDPVASNYYFLQRIEYNGPLGGIHALSLAQFSYLIVAVPSRGLEFYQYCHAEGFKLKLTVPIAEAMDVNAVLRGSDLYFPIASGDDSVRAVMAKGVLQGRLSN